MMQHVSSNPYGVPWFLGKNYWFTFLPKFLI